MTGYFDNWDFRPYVTAIPVRTGVQPKGAVVLMAGGAYQFRGNYTDSLPTAAALRELGFQTFIVDYRLSPYTQEEGRAGCSAGLSALCGRMRMLTALTLTILQLWAFPQAAFRRANF